MGCPAEVLRLVERFEREARRLPLRRLQRDPGPPRVHRPALQGPRLGHGQRGRLRRGLQGRRPRGRHQGRRRDQSARLLLPHRRHPQVLRRSQEAVGQHQGRRRARLPAPPLRLVGQAARSPSSPTSRSSPSTTAASSPTRPTRPRPPASMYLPFTRVRRHAGTRSPAIFSHGGRAQGLVRPLRRVHQRQEGHGRGGRRVPRGDRGAGATTWPATSPCATRASPSANSTSPSSAPSTASSSCASARTAASSPTASCRRSVNGGQHLRPPAASCSSRPTSATTPACSTSTRRRAAREAPDELTLEPGIDDKAAQGHPQAPLLPRQPLRVLACCRPTSWARSTSSSWAR